MCVTLESASYVGEIVGGISTAAAVALAVFELSRRRRERLREKRADAAARALVALTRACEALDAWAAGIEDVTDVEDPDMDFAKLLEDLESLDRKGRDTREQPLREVNSAAVEAYVHLDPQEYHFLSDVHALSLDMRQELASLVTEVENVPLGNELASVRGIRSAFRQARASIRELRDGGATTLQAIARLER